MIPPAGIPRHNDAADVAIMAHNTCTVVVVGPRRAPPAGIIIHIVVVVVVVNADDTIRVNVVYNVAANGPRRDK